MKMKSGENYAEKRNRRKLPPFILPMLFKLKDHHNRMRPEALVDWGRAASEMDKIGTLFPSLEGGAGRLPVDIQLLL
jgi:hypothetical protein